MAQFTPEVAVAFLHDEQRFNVAASHALITGQPNAYKSLDKVVTAMESESTNAAEISDNAYWAMKAEINSLTVAE